DHRRARQAGQRCGAVDLARRLEAASADRASRGGHKQVERWTAATNELADVLFELAHGQRPQAEPVGPGAQRAPAELLAGAPRQEDDRQVRQVLTGSNATQDVEP